MSKLTESSFIELLEQKAKQERRLHATNIMPEWARGVGDWLAINPWRVLVPVAGIVYLVLRIMLGTRYRELIFGLSGGF